MRELLPAIPALPERDPDRLVHVDPSLGVHEAHRRWETRAAQWRARELAEQVFGGEVAARLSGQVGRSAFRGMLHLDVPFADLGSHRHREALFLASAAVDPVLSRVPLVFVLSPAPG